MDVKQEDREKAREASIKAEQIMAVSPVRKKRAAALTSSMRTSIPFQPGGAFDSQTDSQEWLEGLYEHPGHSSPSHAPEPEYSHDTLILRAEEAEEERDNLRMECHNLRIELDVLQQFADVMTPRRIT
ncbi:hypothetical protein R3P38DRAFT_2812206 [Favolaschia claudopus]|uniref:Uncharacterized protein n=1 Tax=Favolaschia claudopus TaxID=2862362 RepID=A0AAV9Z811_9AGAR